MKRVVVIGGGFAGITAVRRLAREDLQVTLIDRSNHHLFQPLLYQVATAGLAAPSIAAPLRHILRRKRNVTVLMGEVSTIDLATRFVSVDGQRIEFDFLLVASGATHAYFGRDEWRQYAPGLKTLDDAFVIRRHILEAFERAEATSDDAARDACLTFAVIGGGPTGVELAGTLAEIARHTLANEFRRIDSRKARVLLVEAGPRLLSTFDERLSASARRQLERLGVEVHTGHAVTAIGDGYLEFAGQHIVAQTILWAAGVAASPLGRQLGAELDRAGRVRVAPDLSLPAHPEVFVIGDLATVLQDGKPVPGVAQAAKQMGATAARNVMARIENRPARDFRYRDLGALATIGRNSAVVQLPSLRFSGVLAWWFWLVLHIYFLIEFRSRLIVLINWAWSYFTYARGARIIIGNESERDLHGSEKEGGTGKEGQAQSEARAQRREAGPGRH
ncbi:MAG TPA: NAD(P)/FAD-dependent oxidoreductase [Steroidobacteraceae bacterium]|nr:NAD(P)/FAD-dependent oxidoreductase [Steroidobacteraceae bacterium]